MQASGRIQANNRRDSRQYYQFMGRPMAVSDLCQLMNITTNTFYALKANGIIEQKIKKAEKIYMRSVTSKSRHGYDDWPGFEVD